MDALLLDRLQEGCERLGLEIPPNRLERMIAHLLFVLEANRLVNLTSVSDPERGVELHVLDSLAGLRAVPPGATLRAVDVGSGAGFPGLPLALALPDSLDMLLVDAQQRRVRVLEEAIRRLGVANARAVQGRAEELGRGALRESLDLAVARAVGSLAVVAECTLPLLRTGGRLIAYRGREGEREAEDSAAALALLGGAVAEVRRLRLPFSGAERTLVVVDKVAPTPARYPRRPGIPEKRPLA